MGIKKGDVIKFESSLYPTYGHSTSIFCILPIIDGELKEEMEIFNTNEVSYQYTATKDCYYKRDWGRSPKPPIFPSLQSQFSSFS